MTLLALDDLDRTKEGLGTGNVITGLDTLSGKAGKDGLGVNPNHVTMVDATMVTANGTTDVAGNWGTLHIKADGSYTYTRTKANIYDAGAPGAGETDVFTYTLQDKNGVNDTARLTIGLLSESATTLDKSGSHVGTAYDDFIDATQFVAVQQKLLINGGDGADKIVALGVAA